MERSSPVPLANEARVLERLGPGARSAGAAVPHVLGTGEVAGRRVHLQSFVPGHSAARVLATRPARAAEVFERLAGWILRWNRLTQTLRPLEEQALERDLLAFARLLAPRFPEGEAYVTRLGALCSQVQGEPTSRVATHNDLTTFNLLLENGGGLGVVDWEGAREDGYPLADLLYAATDVVCAADGYRDRVAAWKACFTPGGAFAERVGRARASLEQALGLSAAAAALSVHACWLGHAADEHRSAAPDAARPFLAIVRELALQGDFG